MNLQDISKPLHGDELIKYLENSKNEREIIADGLIYKHTTLMVAADPGVGKSTVATQVAVELASGLPVFGILNVPKPVKVLYIQTERSVLEFAERLKEISNIYPIPKDNLYITDEYQKLNIMKHDQLMTLIKAIKRDCPNIDVVIIDPIYSMVTGGLKDELRATIFNNAMNLIQKATGAALYYNHHTVKSQYSSSGDVVERDDPFYGSQWLKAHVTGSFYLKKNGNGVKLICKKDNYNVLHKTLELDFDAETHLCSVPKENIPTTELVKGFLKRMSMNDKEFTFNDVVSDTGLSHRQVRRIFAQDDVKSVLNIINTYKNKKYYKASCD